MPLTWWGWWAIGYVGLLIFVATRATVGREATFCSGQFLFRFTVVYAVFALLAALLTRRSIPVSVLVVLLGLIVATWLLRGRALIVGETRLRTSEKIGECARRLCLTADRTVAAHRFVLPGGALDVHLRSVPGLATLMTLRAQPPHRKAELFSKLMAKQYRSPLPVLRIRMR
ncbi:MAG: hypothetical protein ACT4P6_14680 [Gemmatimonadaceae bacterium]